MKIGLVSLTLNAVYPLMEILKEQTSFNYINYVDEGLQNYIEKTGKVDHSALDRMKKILHKAQIDKNNKVLMTCTVFTPHLKELQEDIEIDLYTADNVMLKEAAQKNKKTIIFATFEPSIETSYQGFVKFSNGNIPTMSLIRGDLIGQIKEQSKGYELIVLAQISMTKLKNELSDINIEIMTSPDSIVSLLNQDK